MSCHLTIKEFTCRYYFLEQISSRGMKKPGFVLLRARDMEMKMGFLREKHPWSGDYVAAWFSQKHYWLLHITYTNERSQVMGHSMTMSLCKDFDNYML